MNRVLLIIDPQNDFCDSDGSLYVPGANKDVERLSEFLDKNNAFFDKIFVTLDTHSYKPHIFDTEAWKNSEGQSPEPFSKGKIIFNYEIQCYQLCFNKNKYNYIEQGKLFNFPSTITIWPKHCVKGTWGWQLPQILYKSLLNCDNIPITFYHKGLSLYKEIYSLGPKKLYNILENFDQIFIAGEAKDYCVLRSIQSIISNTSVYSDKRIIKGQLFVIDNATSLINAENNRKYDELYNNGDIIKFMI